MCCNSNKIAKILPWFDAGNREFGNSDGPFQEINFVIQEATHAKHFSVFLEN